MHLFFLSQPPRRQPPRRRPPCNTVTTIFVEGYAPAWVWDDKRKCDCCPGAFDVVELVNDAIRINGIRQ